MTLDKLQNDLAVATQANDELRKETLNTLVTLVKKAATEWRCRDVIPEPLVNEVVIREYTNINEQMDRCPSFRTDLIEQYQKKADIVKEYTPEIMSRDEVTAYIKEHFSDLISRNNQSKLSQAVMQDLRGKADTKLINKVIDNLCD